LAAVYFGSGAHRPGFLRGRFLFASFAGKTPRGTLRNENRAEFWTVFSEVTVGAVPMIFALACRPGNEINSLALLEIADQLEWGLIGMVMSVLLLGWILGRFILRAAPKA
jgi:hypothetical protein